VSVSSQTNAIRETEAEYKVQKAHYTCNNIPDGAKKRPEICVTRIYFMKINFLSHICILVYRPILTYL